MLEKLSGTKVSLQKLEGVRRLRGALGPLLCAVALGSWLDAGAAYALDVPPDAALHDDGELLPVTLNPPGESLVFGADEPCTSPAQATPSDAATGVQVDAGRPGNGTQLEPEEQILEATATGPCVPLAAFAAAGEPVFAAHAAASGFGFSATLGQIAMLAGVPAAIAKVADAVAKRKGKNGNDAVLTDLGKGDGPRGGPRGPGGEGGGGKQSPRPVPEPVSTVLLIAGAALVGRSVQRRAGR